MASRKDNYRIEATVEGQELGVFETWGGGDRDSEDTPWTEGGSTSVPIGGQTSREPISIGRLVKPERDIPIYAWLDQICGKVEAVFTKQYVDDEENPIGKPIIRRGRLKKVTDPEADKNSSDASTFSLELSANSVAV